MLDKCLCKHALGDLIIHLDPLLVGPSEKSFLCKNFLAWLGDTFHAELLLGVVCSRVQTLVNHLLRNDLFLRKLLSNIQAGDEYSEYTSCQALCSLLPLSFCGQDLALPTAELFLKHVISKLTVLGDSKSQHGGLSEEASLPMLYASGAGCSDDFDVGTPNLSLMTGVQTSSDNHIEEQQTNLSDICLRQQTPLLRILCEFVNHGGSQREDAGDRTRNREHCQIIQLEDEMLCQEVQMKVVVVRGLERVWEPLASTLARVTSNLASKSISERRRRESITYLTEGYRLWKSLICIRANLNFVDSRSFAANLSLPVYSLLAGTPPCIWRSVLETVSECLCYGTTLGLQSVPPEEPCQLAHTLIRLVRFEGFLWLVPYQKSLGFGGLAESKNGGVSEGRADEPEEEEDEDTYDKGMVQKIVLIILKAVALTTRESRVDSSSGESDSSLSSRESGSSCSSDLIIIERNMSGMYKQVDQWIKSILPVLPDSSLQENLLHLLQEQDDVLIEGLLCMLDTHIALHSPVRENQVQFDSCPAKGFIKLLSILGGDSSVLLDFLVSNETCFLLYLLRFLKFILKDWEGFMSSCGDQYVSTLSVLLNLKSSIARLLNKELFPYNIGPG